MHTPGPWNLSKTGRSVLAGSVKINQSAGPCAAACGVEKMQDEMLRANARLIAVAPEMLELLQSVAMSPIDLENDGECCMRIKTETMFKIASLVFGTQITEIQTLAGQLVTDAEGK